MIRTETTNALNDYMRGCVGLLRRVDMGGYKPRLMEHEKVITMEEKEILLAYLSTPAMKYTRAAAAMKMVMKTGLRVSEVCRLEVRHCILEGDRPMICVWGGKARKEDQVDTVKVSQAYADDLRDWIDHARPKKYVFEYEGHSLTRNTIWRDCKTVYAALGFSVKYGVHALRHRFITDTYKAFIDPMIAMTQARHKSLSMTTRYIHLATEESEDFRMKLELV